MSNFSIDCWGDEAPRDAEADAREDSLLDEQPPAEFTPPATCSFQCSRIDRDFLATCGCYGDWLQARDEALLVPARPEGGERDAD